MEARVPWCPGNGGTQAIARSWWRYPQAPGGSWLAGSSVGWLPGILASRHLGNWVAWVADGWVSGWLVLHGSEDRGALSPGRVGGEGPTQQGTKPVPIFQE